eukprot:6457590-Amphidinium_carterae.1
MDAWEALTTALEAQAEVYLTLDTACQRTVSGRRYASRLQSYPTRSCEESEAFRFGVGKSESSERRSSAICIGGCELSVCYSIVDANIPLLLSRSGLTQLGAVLDLVSQTMVCTNLPGKPRIPLSVREGHLTVLVSAGKRKPKISRKDDLVLTMEREVPQVAQVSDHALSHELDCDLCALPHELDCDLHDLSHGSMGDFSGGLDHGVPHVLVNALRHPEVVDAQRKGWPISQKIPPTRTYFHAASILAVYQPRPAPQCTNISTEHGDVIRSVSLGGYTRRGVGVTNLTYAQRDVLAACHALATTRQGEVNIPYLAIALTRGRSPPHVDHNDGFSTLTGIGKWQGGQLVLHVGTAEGQMRPFSIRRRWLCFLASHVHSTAEFEGDRLSLSYYVPQFPEKLVDHFDELQQLGFLVR